MYDTNDRQFIVSAMRIEAARPSVTRRLALERDLDSRAPSGASALPAFVRRLRLHVTSAVGALIHRTALAGPETKV